MKPFARLLFITIVSAVLAEAGTGAEVSADASTDGSSFSITATVKNHGTTEETTREIDGVKFIYPVDEADTIELLLPRIREYRKHRKKQAPLEADALYAALADFDHRERIRKKVQGVLGVDQLSFGFDHAYDEALKDIDSLCRQWQEWSCDISVFHLYNHATVKPFRVGPDRVHFREVRYLHKENSSLTVNLESKLSGQGIGIGSFDPDRDTVAPIDLEIFNPVPPGHSAETSAEFLRGGIDVISEVLDKLATDQQVSLATAYLMEKVLLHEIETLFFSSNPPHSITRGLARYHLFASKVEKDDAAAIRQLIIWLFAPDVTGSPEEIELRLKELESLDPLTADSPRHESDFSRTLAFALVQLGQNPGLGSTIFRLFEEKGVEIPEGGFDRKSFLAAMAKVYPEPDKAILETRDDLIAVSRAYLAQKSGDKTTSETEKNATTRTPSVKMPERISQVVDGATISYPPGLEKAVERVGFEWAEALRRFQNTLNERFSDGRSLSPPVFLSDETLQAIRALGTPAERETADNFAKQAAFLANAAPIFLQLFSSRDIQVWTKRELKHLLKNGATIDGFSLKEDGETVKFAFSPKLPIEEMFGSTDKAAIEALQKLRLPAFPVVGKIDGDTKLEDAPLDQQVAALEAGDQVLESYTAAADQLTPEIILGKKALPLNETNSYLVTVHEVVEIGLITDVIASKDRRWFCDGMANLIGIRECNRQFGEGSGMAAFGELFSADSATALSDQVDLSAWPVIEQEQNSENLNVAEAEGLTAAHYYYATKAMLAATEGRGEDFPAKWIKEIKKTNWNRTNAQTVIDAYNKLTGDDLKEIIRSVTKGERRPAPRTGAFQAHPLDDQSTVLLVRWRHLVSAVPWISETDADLHCRSTLLLPTRLGMS